MSDPSSKHHILPYTVVITGIMCCFAPCALALSCAGIYFTPVSTALGVGKGVFAIYLTVMLVVTAFVLPFEGKLMETKDLRAVLSIAVLLIGLPLVAMSFFNAVWQFYIAGAFMGCGLACLLVLAVPTLINRWFSERVGFYIGLCMAFTGIGGVVFNLVGGSLIASGPDGWRTGYLVFGIIALVLALPFTVFGVRSRPADVGMTPVGKSSDTATSKGTQTEVSGVTAKRAMRSAAFFILALYALLLNLAINFYQYLPSYAASLKNFPEIAALGATLASAAMLGQAIGKVLLGIVSDKLNVYAALGVSAGAGAIGTLLMFFSSGSVAVILTGGFLFGMFYAGATVLTPLLTRTAFGLREYSSIYSRVAMVGSLAGAFAASMWGFVVDAAGFTPALVLVVAGAVLVFICGAWALKSSKRLSEEEGVSSNDKVAC